MAASMEMVMDQLTVEWFRIEPASALAGRTVEDTALRKLTGASIIAIMRGGKALPNPQRGDRIEPGDTLLVVGDRQQVEDVRSLLGGRMGDR